MALTSLPLLAIDWPTFQRGPIEPIWVTATVQVVAPIWTVLVLSVLAGFILSRRPRSPLGWAYATSALLFASMLLMQEYAVRALLAAPGSLPAGEVAAWIGAWSGPGMGMVMFPMSLAVLMFPDGRLPGRAWWLAAGLGLVITTGNLIDSTASPWPLVLPMRAGTVPVTMPPALWHVGPPLDGWPLEALSWGYLLFVPLIALLLVLRTRRARGDERFQLRWLMLALAIVAACWIGWQLPGWLSPWALDANAHLIQRWGQLGAIFTGLVVIPGAMAIAIFKYRLYDIDVLIKRTLVYGAVTATLGATYWTTVLVLQSLLSSLTVGSVFAVALSTLLAAALFRPIRSRAQDAVDRRFDRARYDTARTVDAFIERLRHDVELNSVRADLVEVVNSTVQPGHASVWLRAGRG
jgi:hypothetical protein